MPSSCFNSLESNHPEITNSNTAERTRSSNSINATPLQEAGLPSSATLNGSVQSVKNPTKEINGYQSLTVSNEQPASVGSKGSGGESLAASFILGEINADVLKSSVYSQFPSLCSMEACADDVVKLQKLMSEYLDLKNTLGKVNLTMKQFFEKTQQTKNDMLRMEQEYKEQLEECRSQIAALRNENIDLKREINEKIDHFKIIDDVRQEEQAALRQNLSEKTAQMNNMRSMIDKLEEQQLASFEYIPKNENDFKHKPDYVDRLEHERIVKDFERKMSELLAENLDMKDVQKQYIDEITCLKVQLTAAEELIKKMRADICELKSEHTDYRQIFNKYDAEREELREELSLLRQQVEVYSKDFEMERVARQNLAGEKDQILQDLRSLQRKNQELIEEAQQHWANIEKNVSSPSVAGGISELAKTNAPTTSTAAAVAAAATNPSATPPTAERSEVPVKHCCPICSKVFKSLSVLQSHVNDCLDKN